MKVRNDMRMLMSEQWPGPRSAGAVEGAAEYNTAAKQ